MIEKLSHFGQNIYWQADKDTVWYNQRGVTKFHYFCGEFRKKCLLFRRSVIKPNVIR